MSNPSWTRAALCLLPLSCIAAHPGCTSLGPIAGMTMANVVPNDRAGGEISAGLVPGYFLSDAVKEQTGGRKHSHGSMFFDPGDLVPVQGFGAGMRWVGDADDGYLEPMVRYRTFLGEEERVAIGLVGHFASADGSSDGASYSMVKGGLELGLDVRVTPKNRWAELHLAGGASLTGLAATGTYCSNPDTGYGQDCPEGATGDTTVDVAGAYPAGFAGASLDLFTGIPVLHMLRLGAYMAGGTRPGVHEAEQRSAGAWFDWGFAATLGIGAW